ncbi:MAG: PaaI family thioesterase, partial [Sulfurimonas sp.]|nr:PaaI family thioesterase [Sulfurimonas sp.]
MSEELEEEIIDKDEENYKDEAIELEEEKVDVTLKTHEEVNHDLSGEIQKLENGYVELKLVTTHDMIADKQGLIHGGFIFSAADYA